MALGGGTFLTQNKVLPGTYINFISTYHASIFGDRGYAAMGFDIDWGKENEIIEITSESFQKDSMKILGYPYDAIELRPFRELFKNITTLYAYRLNGGGTKASNDYATAKYGGERGNALKIIVQSNPDVEDGYDVSTVLGTTVVDVQTVKLASELVENDYVTFKDKLDETAGEALTGGTNKDIDGAAHQAFLNAVEKYSFNAIGCASTTENIKALYAAFAKRMRDEVGKKFQAVVYRHDADYEGVVDEKNKVLNDANEAALTYWTTGVIAGTAVNKSATNKKYDGEYEVDVNYTQTELIQAIQNGEFTFHMVDNDVRVLEDITSLVTTTSEKGDVFKENQTIRVIDQIANDIAKIFNTRYLGVVPNDEAGRISLWTDIVKQHQTLQTLRAIEGFDESDVVVTKGEGQKNVIVQDAVTVVCAMTKLYMTVNVQ